MSVETKIEVYLSANGQSTVHEIASGIGYSHGYVLRKAKEMKDNSRINGSKTKIIPAVVVKNNYYVLTGDQDYLLRIVRKHAPGKVTRARGLSIEDLQKLIRDEVADRVVGGPGRWEFWP